MSGLALLRRLPWAVWLITAGVLGCLIAVDPTPGGVLRAVVAGACVVLAAIDVQVYRLPNVFVLPLLFTGVLAAVIDTCIAGTPRILAQSLAAGLALGACYLVLALVRPGAMGGGDVKLIVALGLFVGPLGLNAVEWLLIVPFIVGGAVAAVGLVSRRLRPATHLAFGPFLACGFIASLVVSAHG